MRRAAALCLALLILAGSRAAGARAMRKAPADPLAAPTPGPSFAPTTLIPAWDSAPGPVELPDLTLDRAEGIVLTLDRSIELAIEGATSVLKAQNDVRNGGAALLQAYGQFLPNFAVVGDYGYTSGNTLVTTGTPTVYAGNGTLAGYAVTSDLNVFNGLADFSGLRSALLKKDALDLTLERAKQQIALDIAESFLQIVLDDKLVDIARKNLQQNQARDRLLTEQTLVGSRNLSDLFRQQAQTSFAESALLNASNKTRTDQISFLQKLRADVAKRYHFVEPPLLGGSIPEQYRNEHELLRTALQRRADLKAFDEQADAAGWDARGAYAGYLPKLDLLGSAVSAGRVWDSLLVNGSPGAQGFPIDGNIFGQLGAETNYSISLNLSWTIFDRLVTHQNLTRAHVAEENSKIDAQDRRNQVEGDVRQAFGDYKTAAQQLVSSKKGLDAAQKAYEVVEGRYEVGSANIVDLITAQSDLVQAESSRAQALIDFENRGRALKFAVGE